MTVGVAGGRFYACGLCGDKITSQLARRASVMPCLNEALILCHNPNANSIGVFSMMDLGEHACVGSVSLSLFLFKYISCCYFSLFLLVQYKFVPK